MPDQIILDEGARLCAPNLHLSDVVTSMRTEGRENSRKFRHFVLSIPVRKEMDKENPVLFSGENPNAESSCSGCL